MSEKYLQQSVLKESYAVDEVGMLCKVYEVTTREYAVPTGNIVGNEDEMIQAINCQLNYLYYRELAAALAKAEDTVAKRKKARENGKATDEQVLTAIRNYQDASARFGYYADNVTNAVPPRDDVAMLIAMTITNSNLINIDRAGRMLSDLRRDSLDDSEVKASIMSYISENVNLAAAPYFKPYEARVKMSAVQNLRKVATVYTLKYSKQGITEVYVKDKKVFYQVMLELFRDAFKLDVEKSAKSAPEALLNM